MQLPREAHPFPLRSILSGKRRARHSEPVAVDRWSWQKYRKRTQPPPWIEGAVVLETGYQISFRANWICLDVVTVESMAPALS
jgi:hypothetical protein